MNFIIDPKLKKQFPQLHIETIIASKTNNETPTNAIQKLFLNQIKLISTEWDKERIENEKVFQLWREAYRSFGAKPKKHRCSVENLYRMIIEGVILQSINPLVDAYNYISLKYCLPVGGDDLSKVDGDIHLTYAIGDESFTQLNNHEVTNPKPGEIIYKDNEKILCRRWNWRECDQTKITFKTNNVILYLEDIGSHDAHHMQQAKNELRELLMSELGSIVQ